jgi:hypothetical protein
LFNNPSSNSDSAGNFDFTPTSTFTFLANTRYWLLVDTNSGSYNWFCNTPNITPAGISGIVNNGYRFSTNGIIYSSGSKLFNSFQINATEVAAVPFEFNPALGLGVLGGAWLIRKRLKKKKV